MPKAAWTTWLTPLDDLSSTRRHDAEFSLGPDRIKEVLSLMGLFLVAVASLILWAVQDALRKT
jgi:hypothetical protein